MLTAGRLWDEAKNVAAVAQVAPRLPWPVYVAGEDRHPNGTSRRVRRLHACSADLAPDALADWYARAAIYALPARYEPFGLSVLEAALSGCALVLGDIPSLREIWGDAAVFVPPDDPDALADAHLRDLIADPERCARRWRARSMRTRPRVHAASAWRATYLDAYSSIARDRGG